MMAIGLTTTIYYACYAAALCITQHSMKVLHLTTTCEHLNEDIVADEEYIEATVCNALGELMLQQPAQSLALRQLTLSMGWYGMSAATTLFKALTKTAPLLHSLELGRTLQPFKFDCLESLVPQLHKMKHLTKLKLHLGWVSCRTVCFNNDVYHLDCTYQAHVKGVLVKHSTSACAVMYDKYTME
jgi:hypothetical protein